MYTKGSYFYKQILFIFLSMSLVIGLFAASPIAYGAEPPNITLDMYEQIEINMTQAEVEAIAEGPGSITADGILYKGKANDPDAVKQVIISFDENDLVYQKRLSFAFKSFVYYDGLILGDGYRYTGKAKKLTVPAYVSWKVNRDTGETKKGLMEGLDVSGKKMNALNLDQCTRLRYLDCTRNKLTELDVSNCTNLRYLDCGSNKLEKLDVRKCTKMTGLLCYKNKLTKLDLSKNKQLDGLNCESNLLTSLNMKNNKRLMLLACSKNRIKKINVKKNKKLEFLYCDNNRLKKLNVKKNKILSTLDCKKNKIKKLNVTKNKKLTSLYCSDNKLKKLSLKKNKQLAELLCQNNKIKSLNVRKNGNLYCLEVDKKLSKSQLPKSLQKIKPYKHRGAWIYVINMD